MSNARVLADFEVGSKGEALSNALSKINLDYVVNLKNESKGYLSVPKGTTQQEPANAKDGVCRLNTTSGLLEFYSNKKWVFADVEKFSWWGNVDIKRNKPKDIVVYFCGVKSPAVDLIIHTTGKIDISISVAIKDNKGIAKIPANAVTEQVGLYTKVSVKDGKDRLDDLFFKII